MIISLIFLLLVATPVCFGAEKEEVPLASAEQILATPTAQETDLASAPTLEKVHFWADHFIYDTNEEILSAEGSVRLDSDSRILYADKIDYHMKENKVYAKGKVLLKNPPKEDFRAEDIEISDDLKDIIINNFYAKLAEGAFFTARKVKKEDANPDQIRLYKGLYSACEIDANNPKCPLTWSLKASQIKYDEAAKDVSYYNAWFEIKNVPVFWTPYLSHPDPSVRSKSGVLFPGIGTSGDLGYFIEVPLYVDISPRQNFTFTPMFTSKEGVVLKGEHIMRQSFMEIKTNASYTNDNNSDDRWHIFSTANIEIDNVWRTQLKLNRASDDTYLKKYGFTNDAWLTSQANLEGLAPRDWIWFRAYWFQDLRADSPSGLTPLVLPRFEYSRRSNVFANGSYFENKVSGSLITRTNDEHTLRTSLASNYSLPYISDFGHSYTFSVGGMADFYDIKDLQDEATQDFLETSLVRFAPFVEAKWSLPLIKQSKNTKSLLEPMMSVTFMPSKVNNKDIPNEDSLDIDFDDTKLFGGSRFNGYDVLENGTRLSYGVNYKMYGNTYGQISTFIGQEYRFSGSDLEVDNYGLDKGFSDYVGRFGFDPNKFIKIKAQYRVDNRDFDIKRIQLGLFLGTEKLNIDNNYLFYDNYNLGDGNFVKRQEINSTINFAINKNWKSYVMGIYDIENDLRVRIGGGIYYTDDCATFGIRFLRKYTQDRDYDGENFIMFIINLKTLGKLETGFIGMGSTSTQGDN